MITSPSRETLRDAFLTSALEFANQQFESVKRLNGLEE